MDLGLALFYNCTCLTTHMWIDSEIGFEQDMNRSLSAH